MNYRESIIYKNKADLIERAFNVFNNLGITSSPFELQASLIVRKKKFSDDVGERLDKHKWQGVTKSLKDYIQFNVKAKIEAVESSNSLMQRQVMQQLLKMQG